ncbi:hypothetical protein [Sulfolobus sp. S-194]|nr:hypothetical protein [Sulfolobus sp. S-194]
MVSSGCAECIASLCKVVLHKGMIYCILRLAYKEAKEMLAFYVKILR